jgi:hypothetical protein
MPLVGNAQVKRTDLAGFEGLDDGFGLDVEAKFIGQQVFRPAGQNHQRFFRAAHALNDFPDGAVTPGGDD